MTLLHVESMSVVSYCSFRYTFTINLQKFDGILLSINAATYYGSVSYIILYITIILLLKDINHEAAQHGGGSHRQIT